MTDEDFKDIANFNLTPDGEYSDWSDYTVRPTNKERTRWEFRLFSELDGSSWHVKYLKDMDDLKSLYLAITNKPIEFYVYTDTDGERYTDTQKEKYLLNQAYIDGTKKKCEECRGRGRTKVNIKRTDEELKEHEERKKTSTNLLERISTISPTYTKFVECVSCKV